MGGRPTIHVNPALAHQVACAHELAAGFKRHGIQSVITPNPTEQGDWHVCVGPWFAKDYWPECLYLDRAYWGDPDSVSVHWLAGGEKVRTRGNPHRPHPELKPMKNGDRRVYLCDFRDKPRGRYHCARYHPNDRPSRYTLQECLQRFDVAIGRRTTALVTAHIAGLRVETDDENSPVYGIADRVQWVHDLAWHNWGRQEIVRGDMWAFLSK